METIDEWINSDINYTKIIKSLEFWKSIVYLKYCLNSKQ